MKVEQLLNYHLFQLKGNEPISQAPNTYCLIPDWVTQSYPHPLQNLGHSVIIRSNIWKGKVKGKIVKLAFYYHFHQLT